MVSERFIIETPYVATVVGAVLFFIFIVTPVRVCYVIKAKKHPSNSQVAAENDKEANSVKEICP